jgi:hypothetical protein
MCNDCSMRRLHKLEKLVSDPYLLYLANKNMFKLTEFYSAISTHTWIHVFTEFYTAISTLTWIPVYT